MLIITPHLQVQESEFEWSYARSGGPGGQNVNKVATKAVLRWNVTNSPSVPDAVKARFCAQNRGRLTDEGVFFTSSDTTRSQLRNKQECLDLLAALLLAATKLPRRRVKTRPTRGSKERRLKDKRERSFTKTQRQGPKDD
ncbi:MAG TPA: alternative ribosome rescue aminoacyl-tRNA hydrolase ArfB [Gemmataceae bacterium]|nr:alternative ribosome rescue aminoacyl-tRNA hydrolase ArfB [Gemmataceae bacterium]